MNFSNQEQSHRMFLLGCLYVTQFLGLGFIITAVPAIMRENGASLDEIGIIYVLGLIWSVKFLWAPLVDRFGSKTHGHYRSWLLILQGSLVVLLLTASLFDIDSQLNILAIFFALISIFSATQDIAADALAVIILKPEERGIGNSIQMGGGFIGNMIGGGIVLIAYEWIGWTASLCILAIATAIPVITIWRYEEPPTPVRNRTEKVGYQDMVYFFRRSGSGGWIAVLLSYTLGISVVYAILNPMLVDLGWPLDRIGFALNIVGSVVSIAGAFCAGIFVQRIGRKSVMLAANFFVGLSIFFLFPVAQGYNNGVVIYGCLCFMYFAYGVNSTILATVMMDKSNPTSAGTDYTIQYSLSSIIAFIFSGGALAFAETIGYAGVLFIGIGVTLISLIIVWFYNDFEPVSFEENQSKITIDKNELMVERS